MCLIKYPSDEFSSTLRSRARFGDGSTSGVRVWFTHRSSQTPIPKMQTGERISPRFDAHRWLHGPRVNNRALYVTGTPVTFPAR